MTSAELASTKEELEENPQPPVEGDDEDTQPLPIEE